MNLVKPIDGAKHDVLFNKPASDLALLNIKVRLKQCKQCDQNHKNNCYKLL
jgi:hypothetical protein